MSCTEIFTFDKAGNAHFGGEIQNAWCGGMAIWREMEERYLPAYVPDYIKHLIWYRPDMTPEEIERFTGFKPTRVSTMPFGQDNPMQEVWDLADNQSVPEHERIVLFTTFDRCLVKREDIPKVLEAFRKFEGETNLPEQANIIEKLMDDENCIAIGWNQTSVNVDTWENAGGYDEEKDETIPYNCLTGDNHFWLFDELKEANSHDE